jgi:phage recombination protein Bet
MPDDTTTPEDNPMALEPAELAALRQAAERAQARINGGQEPDPADLADLAQARETTEAAARRAERPEVLPARRPDPPALAAGEVALTPAQKELIAQLNPTATAGELAVFFYQAARTGLDPIAHQIYLVKRRTSGGQDRMTIQTGIDGYRLVAARTGLMAGSDDPTFDGEIDDDRCQGGTRPFAATVTVYRIAADGHRYPYTATARWDEYAPDLREPAGFMWAKLPYLMLGKCAEALALRKAFPAELSGIYTDAEMDQARGALGGGEAEPDTTVYVPNAQCPTCGSRIIDRSTDPDLGEKPPYTCSNRRCEGGGKRKRGDGRWPWAAYSLADIPIQRDAGDPAGEPQSTSTYDRIVQAVARFTGGDLLVAEAVVEDTAASMGLDPRTVEGGKANRLMADSVRAARLGGQPGNGYQ